MSGRFHSYEITTVGNDEDIISTIRTKLAGIPINPPMGAVKTLTISSADNIGIDINNLGVYSYLAIDTDSKYKLSIKNDEVIISSLKIETLGHTLHVYVVFS